MASDWRKKFKEKIISSPDYIGYRADTETKNSTASTDWRQNMKNAIIDGSAAKRYQETTNINRDALMANNPAYVYSKVYGNGKTGAAAKKVVSGKRTTADEATHLDNVMAAAINSTLSAFQKLAADSTSSAGSLSMGESARAAIDEVKTAKKEGRQAKLGQAQRNAEQEKKNRIESGAVGDLKQAFTTGAQKSAESAYESERHAKEGLGKFGQGVVDFGIAGAQFAGDALLNAVAPGTGLAAMAGRAYGSASLDAQQRGLSEGEQQISGLKSAAIEMLTEKLFGSVSKVAYGKGIIRNESLVNSLVNRLAKTDRGRTALKVLVGANEEGLEEVLSDILNPIADRILKLDDGKGDWSDLADDFDTQQMLEDYIIGGALGLAGAGTNVVSGQYRAENAQQRAYEEYQRQLVNAGLATEQGGDAQLTAEKYRNILDQSTQRGKRNLSDKETENLERLMTIGTDTQTMRDMLAQSGVLVDDNTAEAAALAASGQKLSNTQNAAIGNAAVQDAINQMVGNGVVDNIRRTAANEYSKPIVINSMARQYEVAPEVVERTYNLNPTAPQAFETAFNAVYQMGQQGTDKAALGKVPVLNTAQANIAYQMGADSVNAANVSTEAPTQAATVQAAAPVNINNTQEVNENGVRIHNVAERINGQNTEGQIRGVETGTGENVAGGSQKEQGGISAAQIKAGEKVSYKGKQQKGVYYAAEDTEDMKKGRKLAESYGYKVRYFVGGNIRYAGGKFRGVADTANKTVMVRADHPDYTAEQIMRHEMGHAAFENGDLSLNEAKEMLLGDFTEDELNELIEIYNNAYGGILSTEEAFEEICCDALGRMNIFENTPYDGESYEKAQDTVRKYAAEKNNSKGRAPPKKGGVKYSRQAEDKYFARQIDQWDGKDHGGAFRVGDVSEPLLKVGIPNTDIWFDQSKAAKQLLEKGEITKSVIKQIPEILQHPIAISESYDNTVMVFGQVFDANGNPIVVALRVNSTKRRNSITLVNKIRSVGSRSHNLDKLLNDSNILYLGENKKETKAWFNALGRSTPFGGTKFGLIRSVSFADAAVKKYSLEPVRPIQPKNGEWERGSTTDEVRAKHPDLWAVDAESSESRNPTQISGTVKSYRKIYDALKAEGFDGTVLDASSGLGYGTRAGIEEYGFNVEDIEPFPDNSYKPKYTDYSKLHKKYDVIISNAVLNVLPQDQRDALVVKMGQMLNDGGRMFINVRGTDVRNASSKVPIDETNMEYYISNTGSYQKGFTKKELVAYLSDALGKDYTVVGTNKFGAVSAVVTKQAEVSEKFSREVKSAEEYFGTTYKVKEAGYICTDGKMLDFSGRHEGAPGGYRTVDHRDITDALGEDYGGEDYSGGMIKFMSEGNIRVSPESGGINLSVSPNKAQRSTLDRYISSFRGEVILDIDRTNGDTIASVEYPKYTHSSVVFKDIDDYFDKGKIPEKFSREPERLNELRRQNERKLAQATAEDAANENERGLIRDYQKQYSKVEDIREKLSTAQQTLAEAEDSGADYDTTTKARNRFTVLSNQYAREHRKLENYANMKALQNVLTRVDERLGNDLPEGMGAASANFTGEETVGERWVTEAQGKGDSALHPISKEQEANLAEQQHRAPQEIPKKDLNGKLTSKHVSTIVNSGMTPAEFSEAMLDDAALGKFSHIKYSDEEALEKANGKIAEKGWTDALANYKAEINSGRVSKDNTVMGIALYNNAVNSGDYATAMDIASLMVKNSTNTAQSLQAMRILNKLSPECRLYLAAKSIENIEENLNERYKDNKADIHVDKILYDEYAKALRQGDEDGIKTAWANIEQNVAQQIDATWYEKLNNFRYLAMLGNPRTHVRNIVGNAFFVPVRAVKNTIAYGLENIADAKINGGIERSKAILNPNNAADAALVKYAMSDYEAVQEVILSGGKYVDTFQGIDKHRTIYKTKILEAARKGNSAALDAEDAWFCKPAYANALAKWYKANGISAEQLNTGKVPEETIIKAQTIAIKEAQKATYRDTNWFSAQVSKLGKVDNKVAAVLIEGVLPFKKTPANILARAVEYSPVGLIKSLALDTKKVKAYVNGNVENGMSPAEFIDDISAGLTGSALMGLGILLASWGVLSGGDDDDEKQNYFDELSGKQNYALSIGGLSITLDWLAPESMPLFVGVELFNSLSSKNEDKGFLQNLMSSVMSLSTPMFEMSMLQSVNDLFDNLAYIKQGQGTFKIVSSMAANYISQYFPTLFGQIERSFEEAQRETTYIDRNSNVGSELQYMWGKIANKIPFYDFSQIPYIDAWGRTEETGNLFERMLNNFINPAYVKKERPTEIDGELERLYDLGETSVYPGRAKTNTKINGEYLTADEYVKYATTKGQTSYELAQGVINSAAYSGASDPEKAYMLKYVYSYADHIAKYEVNNDYSLAKWEMAAYKSANPMQAIIDHAREYYNPDKEN